VDKSSRKIEQAYVAARVAWWLLAAAGLVAIVVGAFVLGGALLLGAAALMIAWDVLVRRLGYEGGFRWWPP